MAVRMNVLACTFLNKIATSLLYDSSKKQLENRALPFFLIPKRMNKNENYLVELAPLITCPCFKIRISAAPIETINGILVLTCTSTFS